MKRAKPPTERAIARHVDPARVVLTAEERAVIDALTAALAESYAPELLARAADLAIEPGNKVLAVPRLLAILQRVAPKGQ